MHPLIKLFISLKCCSLGQYRFIQTKLCLLHLDLLLNALNCQKLNHFVLNNFHLDSLIYCEFDIIISITKSLYFHSNRPRFKFSLLNLCFLQRYFSYSEDEMIIISFELLDQYYQVSLFKQEKHQEYFMNLLASFTKLVMPLSVMMQLLYFSYLLLLLS